MKFVLISLLLFLSWYGYGQDPGERDTTTTVNTDEETVRQLYQRLNYKYKGKLGNNQHQFYPTLSTAISFGENVVQEEIKPLFKDPKYLSLDYRVGYQTTGRNIYDQLWRYPEWGIGYYGVKLFNDSIFGVPNAVFAYIDIPINKWNPGRRWTFSYSLGGGLSFNFRPNNPQSNPLNTLIGSYNNVYIDLAFWANARLTNTFDAKFGLSLVHFSNGASTLPNYGINLIGAKAILKHHFVQQRPEVHTHKVPEWKKRHGFFIYQAFGSKQLSEHGTNYFNSTTSFAYKYWAYYKGQWLVQLDWFYDTSANSGEEPREIVPLWDRNNSMNQHSLGIFAGYEAIFNRWSFVSGWGVYLWRNYDFTNVNYQRFGVRYRIYQGLVVGAGLKARTFAADYIEWSVGYNIF